MDEFEAIENEINNQHKQKSVSNYQQDNYRKSFHPDSEAARANT